MHFRTPLEENYKITIRIFFIRKLSSAIKPAGLSEHMTIGWFLTPSLAHSAIALASASAWKTVANSRLQTISCPLLLLHASAPFLLVLEAVREPNYPLLKKLMRARFPFLPFSQGHVPSRLWKNHFMVQSSIVVGGSRPSVPASFQSKRLPIMQFSFMWYGFLNAAPRIHSRVVLMQPTLPPGKVSGNCPTPSLSFLICSMATRP